MKEVLILQPKHCCDGINILFIFLNKFWMCNRYIGRKLSFYWRTVIDNRHESPYSNVKLLSYFPAEVTNKSVVKLLCQKHNVATKIAWYCKLYSLQLDVGLSWLNKFFIDNKWKDVIFPPRLLSTSSYINNFAHTLCRSITFYSYSV